MIVGVGSDSIDTHYGQNIFDTEVNSSTGGHILMVIIMVIMFTLILF